MFDKAPTVKVGFAFTVKETVDVFEQEPLLLITVYIVVVAGETTVEEPVAEPGIHVYVVAPEAVNVELLPLQITLGDAEAVTLGIALTVNITVFVLEQEPVLPVTVYMVVVAGETTVVEPVAEPGIQVYVAVPNPVKVAEAPAHIAVGLDTAVTVGFGVTVKFKVSVAVQPKIVAPTTV